MIEFTNFTFSYNKKYSIYSDMNMRLEKGKIYGLFGKNGAGKSTLLKNIAGINRPTKGTISVNGHSPHQRKPSFLGDLFMIPEEVYVPRISLKNYAKIYSPFYPKFSKEAFDNYIDLLDVPKTKNLSKLSFGQQKKFSLAFGLACNTSVVILDEPTNGLDIPSKSQFRKLIAQTMTDDKTFIISTHQVRDLDQILDHLIIVNKGKVIFNQSTYDISQKIAFNFYPAKPTSNGLLAIEEVIGGYSVMERNQSDTETTINLEQLFNTAVVDTESIQEVFPI